MRVRCLVERSQHAIQLRGVTLRDVIVAVVLVVLLGVIVIPAVRKGKESSRRTGCASRLAQIFAGLSAYAETNDGYGPTVIYRVGRTAPRNLLSRYGGYTNLGLLLDAGTIDNADAFYCPSQRRFDYGSNPDLCPAATVCGSFVYAIHAPAEASPRLPDEPRQAIVSDDFVAGVGTGSGIGRYAHRVGYNVLHADGHVRWFADDDETIWQRVVRWDDETDEITYSVFAAKDSPLRGDAFGRALDVFRVWRAFGRDDANPF